MEVSGSTKVIDLLVGSVTGVRLTGFTRTQKTRTAVGYDILSK